MEQLEVEAKGMLNEDEIYETIIKIITANVLAAYKSPVGEVFEKFGPAVPVFMVASWLGSDHGLIMNKCIDPSLWALHCFEIWNRMLDGEELAEMTIAEHVVSALLKKHNGEEISEREKQSVKEAVSLGIKTVNIVEGEIDTSVPARSIEAAQDLALRFNGLTSAA